MDILADLTGIDPIANHVSKRQWCEKICVDGTITKCGELVSDINSSPFHTGLCISDEFALKGNQPFQWREHYMNIVDSLVKIGVDRNVIPFSDELKRRIEVLCQKNHYPPYSLVKLIFWLDADSGLHYAILHERLKKSPYDPSREHFFVSIFRELPIFPSEYSWIQFPSFVDSLARKDAQRQKLDEACLVDSNGRIVRTTAGNIYLLMKGSLVGVGYADGALKDPICQCVEEAAKTHGYEVKYVVGITEGLLNKASECFIVSSKSGVTPVAGCGERRFSRDFGVKIADTVNKQLVF